MPVDVGYIGGISQFFMLCQWWNDCLVAVCNANSTCQKKLLCFSCGQWEDM